MRPGAVPESFIYKPAEEFSGEETAWSPPTKEGDVYAFASTVFQVHRYPSPAVFL